MKNITNILILLLVSGSLSAQEVLTLEDAIAVALEQNYSITIARNDAFIAEKNAHPGAAGLLPNLGANAGVSYSAQNTKQVFAGGIPPNETKWAESTSYNAGVEMTYTLFDGLGNVYTFKKLNSLASLGEVQTRLLIENTLLQVISKYMSVAQLSENYRILLESTDVSADRFNRQKEKSAYGGPKLDELNAEVDLNTDSVSLITAYNNLENAKRDLNVLLGRKADTEFEIDLNVSFDRDLMLDDLTSKALANNASLVLATQQLQASKYDVKLANAQLYPILSGNASYGFNKQENEVGILLENQTDGFSGGLSLRWNLFSGKTRLVQIQNAKIQLESDEASFEQALLQVERDVMNAFATYQTNLYTLAMDQRNLEVAKLNFTRTEDSYKLGQVTNTQFREAQLNLLIAEQRINQSMFNAKLAEIELYRLSGLLLDMPTE